MRALFTVTLFVSAMLLFAIQPMIGKLILPVFGGVPAVWNTCMVVFQLLLLAGYCYAHVITTWLRGRWQVACQLAVALLPLAFLPISLFPGWSPPSDASPVFWLTGLLLVSVGIPFFSLATSAPLLQRWYSYTDPKGAVDPYTLYAASNIGSMLALLGYPLIVEPYLTLKQQALLWSAGYFVLLALVAACGVAVLRSLRGGPSTAAPVVAPSAPVLAELNVSARRWLRLRWVALAFVPSSMMLGMTTYLSTNISPMPLLWVAALALYLATFIITFSRPPAWVHRGALLALPVALLLVTFFMLTGRSFPINLLLVVQLAGFFIAALACHGELARLRPPVASLTEFYLWMSVGGALGGIFNSLVAPLVFQSLAEYPLSLVLAALLMPALDTRANWAQRALDLVLPMGLALLMAGLLFWWPQGNFLVQCGLPPAICLLLYRRPARFALGLAAICIAANYYGDVSLKTVHQERGFFGVLRVNTLAQGRAFSLFHGNIRHGIQIHSTNVAVRRKPLLYYYPTGPIGQVFQELNLPQPLAQVGVVGLGVGSLAAYGRAGQEFTFFEVDPLVAKIAQDPRYFSQLHDCPANLRLVLGDARQTLAREPDQQFNLLVLDAYSGDSPPLHLLTREALELYLAKLAPRGVIAFHITSDYIQYELVLGRLAKECGLAGRVQYDVQVPEQERQQGKEASMWAVLARGEDDLRRLPQDPRWQPLQVSPHVPVWTDDYSNIFSVLNWNAKGL